MISLRSASQVFVVVVALLAASAHAKTLTIAIDQSKSNPVVTDPPFAKVAGEYAGREIVRLSPGDWVRIKTFGERTSAHISTETFRITRREPAGKIAAMVAQYIASLPGKTLQGQGATNIVATLEFGSGFDCAANGKVLLISDGVESSAVISASALLAGQPLPPAKVGVLRGCSVEMVGLGQSRDGSIPPVAIKRLEAAWAAWMKTAGASFTAIVDP